MQFQCQRQNHFTVAECIPTKIFGLFDRVVFEEQPKRCRRTVVKEDEHLAMSRSFETTRSKIKNRCELFSRQVEPFRDVFYAGSCFEIFEDCSHRHSRTPKDPGTAHFTRYAFDQGAL